MNGCKSEELTAIHVFLFQASFIYLDLRVEFQSIVALL